MSKKILSILIAISIIFSNAMVYANDSETNNTDRVSNFTLLNMPQSGETKVGIDVPIYSGDAEITKDSVIIYEREDKTLVEFKSVESTSKPGVYYFLINPDQKGLWKAVEFDGIPINDPSFNLRAFNNDDELDEYFNSLTVENRYTVTRTAGENRYETALKAANHIMDAKIAILASGENFADALFAGPLASYVSGPVLLTSKDKLPEGLLEKLSQMKVDMIYLVGGENSISEDIELKLKEDGFSVKRLAGKNRHQTAAILSDYYANLRGVKVIGDSPTAIVSGVEFADALSSAPYIYYTGINRFVPDKGYIKNNDLVIGGLNSVPGQGEEKRIAGKDRYETALKIAEETKELLKEKKNYDIKRVIIVDGTKYPDALSAGPISTIDRAPILLTRPDKLDPEIAKFIVDNKIKSVIIIGGENSVSKAVEEELRGLR